MVHSYGGAEVRKRRRKVVKTVNRALEGVERVVGDAVEKRLFLVVSSATVIEEPLKESDVDENVVEVVSPASSEEHVGVLNDLLQLIQKRPPLFPWKYPLRTRKQFQNPRLQWVLTT